ncbi:small s protein [Hypomontagnella submonticulosa]|nr:small s protein [Hypomontagnella submonticulosa]
MDPFSITAGAIGIATAFSTCVACFNSIQEGRHFGRDLQTKILILQSARLRLMQWGKAVHIGEDPKLGKPDATAEETQTATQTLYQIVTLFLAADKISKKYNKLGRKAFLALPTGALENVAIDDVMIQKAMEKVAAERRRKTRIWKLSSWSLYHNSEFEKLITNIASLVENLERLFPGTSSVQPANAGVSGHRFNDIQIRGECHAGDIFCDGWNRPIGMSHMYDGIEVGETGKASMGNKYGGRDLWDD